MRDPRGVPLLVPLLNDREVHWIVPWSLGEIGTPDAIEALMLVLEQEDPSIRVLAILALEKSNAREALPKLRTLLQDDRKSNIGDVRGVADAARHAIATISRTK